MSEKYYQSMEKANCCQPGKLCDYHSTKVNSENISKLFMSEEKHSGSANPPKEVWGKDHIEAIEKIISEFKNNNEYKDLNTINKISTVLEKVNSFWQETKNSNALNGTLHDEWVKWSQEAIGNGKYGAIGWKASPQQLSQLIEVLKVLREENVKFEDYLRLGTASGKHTQQEIFAMAKSGMKKPELAIVDLCEPPLIESKVLANTPVKETIIKSVLELPEEMNGKYSIATAHFIESFLPTKKSFDDSKMDHRGALSIKEKFFLNTHNALKEDGFFITILGIEDNNGRRFNNLDELKRSLETAGFKEENIVIAPTTDPLDYDKNKKNLQSGNYFIVAEKK